MTCDGHTPKQGLDEIVVAVADRPSFSRGLHYCPEASVRQRAAALVVGVKAAAARTRLLQASTSRPPSAIPGGCIHV
jgi:hypothetical protein